MATLADLRFQAQSRADRINGPSTPQEWTNWVNSSAGELYRKLTSLYEDYNVRTFSFTLTSGEPNNALLVGAGTSVPDFDKLRKLSVQVEQNGTSPVFVPVLRCNSMIERDRYTGPNFNAYYGNVATAYLFYGNVIEMLPPQCAAGNYRMWYVPRYTRLVQDQDTIDGSWMATSGIEEYIVIGAAIKQLIKEESLDTAQLLAQEQGAILQGLIAEFAPRDDNQPGKIARVKMFRRGFPFPNGGPDGGPGW